jgi:hypothetical protein
MRRPQRNGCRLRRQGQFRNGTYLIGCRRWRRRGAGRDSNGGEGAWVTKGTGRGRASWLVMLVPGPSRNMDETMQKKVSYFHGLISIHCRGGKPSGECVLVAQSGNSWRDTLWPNKTRGQGQPGERKTTRAKRFRWRHKQKMTEHGRLTSPCERDLATMKQPALEATLWWHCLD